MEGRELVLVVGPAGAGKTTALGPVIEQLRAQGRAVFGVAPSAAAAEILAHRAGLASDTLDELLVEQRLQRPPDDRYDPTAGATVVVDQAAMVPTLRLAGLAELAEHRRWRLVLVGDPLQFSAVGRSGMFGHLIDRYGPIELDRVHRVAPTSEREASLHLRWETPMCWPSTTTTVASTARAAYRGAGGSERRVGGPIARRGRGDDVADQQDGRGSQPAGARYPVPGWEVDLAGPLVEAGSCPAACRRRCRHAT